MLPSDQKQFTERCEKLASKIMEDWMVPDERDEAGYEKRLAEVIEEAALNYLEGYEKSGWIKYRWA